MGIDKILIADDDFAFVNRLKNGLLQFGQFVVLTAPDGKHALRLLKTQKVSLVVTDLDMPKLDGLELLAAMTRKHPNVLSIVSTSLKGNQLQKKTRGESLFSYLNKPYDHVKLHSEIIKVLDCLDEIQFKPGIYPSSLLPLIHICRKTCVLEVQGSGGRKGFFSFFDGLLCNAVQGSLSGREAVEEMFGWDPCKYWFRAPDPACSAKNTSEKLTRFVLKETGTSLQPVSGKKTMQVPESIQPKPIGKEPDKKRPDPQPAPGELKKKSAGFKQVKKDSVKEPPKMKAGGEAPSGETPLEKKLREVLAEMPTRLGPAKKAVAQKPPAPLPAEEVSAEKPSGREASPSLHRVVIIDDSIAVRQALKKILSSDDSLEIVGEAACDKEALGIIKEKKPDVVTLDIQMPRMDGLTILKSMMIHSPTPTIILSSVAVEGAAITFDMLKYGAVDFLAKPVNLAGPGIADQADEIIRRIHLAAAVKIESAQYIRSVTSGRKSVAAGRTACKMIVCMGAAEGGYAALLKIIPKLAGDLPAAYFVILNVKPQHVDAFIDYLKRHSTVGIQRAINGLPVDGGTCYLASGVEEVCLRRDTDGKITMQVMPTRTRPDGNPVNTLMFSLAEHLKNNAIGIILSGSGRDGSEGIKEIRKAGGMAIIQNPAYCLHKEMVENARMHVDRNSILSEAKIAETINRSCRQA